MPKSCPKCNNETSNDEAVFCGCCGVPFPHSCTPFKCFCEVCGKTNFILEHIYEEGREIIEAKQKALEEQKAKEHAHNKQ